ncbi:MAG: polysulfide reductase NrfD [Desulfurococcales archaeon]|nr:polysulfide reductase NrfD [Desulfurococcales archaeon]
MEELIGRLSDIGNVFPNEVAYDYSVGGVIWRFLIVLYPFFTGLIAGSFVVSSLAYGLGNKRYYKVAGLALLLTASLMVVPLFPMAELKQPGRAPEIFTRPHLFPSETYPGVSPMAVFGVIYLAYLILLVFEVLFTFRADMARKAAETGRAIYKVFSLGRGYDEASVRVDRAIVKALAIIGIPLAATFHAYVGFLFSSVKARILWMDTIIPVHFLTSAIFSGTALVVIAYYLAGKLSKEGIDLNIMKGLGWIMLWSLLISLGLELVSEAARAYYLLPAEGIKYYEELLSRLDVRTTYYALSIIILVILLIPRLRNDVRILLPVSVLSLVQVAMYRWIIIITPQLLSRTEAGFLHYSVEAHEVRLAIGIIALMGLIFVLLTWLFPWNGYYATHRDELEEVSAYGK